MKKQQKFALSILTVSLFSATSAMAADTDSPFATPVHLSNPGMTKTVTITKSETTPKVATWDVTNTSTSEYKQNKPNIMLYLDDSGSMNGWKANSLKRVLPSLVREYGDKASWGITWMGSFNSSGARNREVALTDNYQDVINAIDRSWYNDGTPFLTGYVNAVDKFAKTPIPLSCTDNYVIAMSDGSANSDSYEYNRAHGYSSQGLNSYIRNSDIWRQAGVSEYNKLTVAGKTFEPYQFGEDCGAFNQKLYGLAWRSDTWGMPLNCTTGRTYPNLSYGLSQSEIEYLDGKFLKQLSDPLFKNTNIKTYTVAYGMGSSSADARTKYMLKKGAIGEGTYNGNPTYFDANDEQGLRDAFARMFEEMTSSFNDGSEAINITQEDPSTSAPTVDENTGSAVVSQEENKHAIAAPAITGENKLNPQETVALWLPIGDEGGLRSAELRFYKPNYDPNNHSLSTLDVDSTFGIPDYKSYRRSYISDKNNVSPMNSYFMTGSNTYFALNAYNSKSDEWENALLPWMSRSKDDSAIKALGYTENTDYRQRSYPMGDILESDIVTVGNLVDDDAKVGFAGRKEFIVAAANDGMAYVFQSNSAQKEDNAKTPYNLMMTYAPSALQRQNTDDTLATHYKKLAKEDYAKVPDNPHLYMLSGGIVGHTLNEPFHIDYMVGNAGRGAKGLYAMNVSAINESSDWAKDVPLFDAGAHRGGQESKMGYTVGYPSTARFGKNVVSKNSAGQIEHKLNNGIIIATAVGSGFSTKTNLAEQETALYLYDTLGGVDVGNEGCGYDKNNQQNNTKNSVACVGNKSQRGKLLSKATIGNTGGLATPVLVDIDMNGVVDYAFAGDYSGNMYRCDVRDYNNIDCVQIFAGNTNRPVTSAPVVARLDNGEYVVTWGTGSDMFVEDVKENKRQALYGVYQKFDNLNNIDKEYAGKVFTEKDLLQQTMVEKGGSWETGTLLRYIDESGENSAKMRPNNGDLAYKGWMLELDAKRGERVVVQPMIVLRTVYFSTRVYGETDLNGSTSTTDTSWNTNWTDEEWIDAGWDTNGWQNLSSNSVAVCSTNKDDIQNGRGGWSAKVLLDEQSSSSSSATNKCINHTSTTNTLVQKYQSTCTEGESKQIVYSKPVGGTVAEQYSALIQLDVQTGGNLTKDSSSYIVLNKGEQVDPVTGQYIGDGSLASSLSFKGILSWMTNVPRRNGLNTNEHGNVAERGVFAKLPKGGVVGVGGSTLIDGYIPNTNQINNGCTPPDGKSTFDAIAVSTDGMYHAPGYENMTFNNCLRRISWREIY